MTRLFGGDLPDPAIGPCCAPCGAADWRGAPNVRLPELIAGFRAQGRLGQLSAMNRHNQQFIQMTSIVGEAPSRATKPTTVVGYIIIIPVQASDPFAVALLERFGECGFRCFVACAVTRNDPDRAYALN